MACLPSFSLLADPGCPPFSVSPFRILRPSFRIVSNPSFQFGRSFLLSCSSSEAPTSDDQGPPQEAILKAISGVSKTEGRVGQTTNVVIGGTVADDSTNEWLALDQKKKVTEEGKSLPEFADDEEKLLYEYLNLQLQSDLNVERMRHYEVVYLIHENYAEEVEDVNKKIQDFLREKKGRIWRASDWGMRRLAYKIKKAKNAHYFLMNFELEAKWINDFKSMLDKDERIIRHLVIKRDEAITEDCQPPPEFHTIRQGMDEFDEDDEIDFDDEDLDEHELFEDEEDGIVYVSSDDEVAEREVIQRECSIEAPKILDSFV